MPRANSQPVGSKTERLLDLTLTLLDAHQPLSPQEIQERVLGYPQGPGEEQNFKRMFERDKRTLRDQGVDIQIRRLPLLDTHEEGYLIDSQQFYLQGLDLTATELTALYLAQSAIPLGQQLTDSAIRKLGGRPLESEQDSQPGSLRAGLLAELPEPPALLALLAAKLGRKVVTFRYGGQLRELLIWRLDYSQGKWFVTGYDPWRLAERTFALERISSELTTRPSSHLEKTKMEPPEKFNPNAMGIRAKPWEVALQPVVAAKLLVHASQVEPAERKLGSEAVVARHEDGSAVFELAVGNWPEFYSLALFFLDEAEILAPAELRAGFAQHLRSLAAGSGEAGKAAGRKTSAGATAGPKNSGRAASEGEAPADASPSPTHEPASKLSAEERFERLLTLVPEVLKQGGTASLKELAQRFDYPRQRLRQDLDEVLRYVAPWPRTPDLLADLQISGDTVTIANADFLARPPQLTAEEALGLYASASAVLAAKLSANEHLRVAAEKLRAALSARSRLANFERVLQVDVAAEIPAAVWDNLQTALRQRRRLQLRYHSFGKGVSSAREVDVHGIFARHGSWYVSCWCHRAQAVRVFRCDQIEDAALLSEQFDELPETGRPANRIYHAQPNDPRVALRLAPEAAWAAEAYDSEQQAVLPDGRLEVRLAIGNRRFLEYLLLLLGAAAELADSPPEIPSDLAEQAVARILAHYEGN